MATCFVYLTTPRCNSYDDLNIWQPLWEHSNLKIHVIHVFLRLEYIVCTFNCSYEKYLTIFATKKVQSFHQTLHWTKNASVVSILENFWHQPSYKCQSRIQHFWLIDSVVYYWEHHSVAPTLFNSFWQTVSCQFTSSLGSITFLWNARWIFLSH